MRISINGQAVEAAAGSTVAAAVAACGVPTRRSVTGEGRGPLCGMGICFECRVTINGRPHQRSCQIAVAEGMEIATAVNSEPWTVDSGGGDVRECEVLVVGAGPAGLAAARAASGAGLRVTLVDDNLAAGGQIWRGTNPEVAGGVELLTRTRVVDAPERGVLRASTAAAWCDLRYRTLILATGARERFLPFPGWTLPQVMGAGGLQAMAKGGLPIAGKRVVVAGTGPLLVAVAAWLRQHGAKIVAVCDQTPWAAQMRFLARLPWAKVRQGVGLAAALRGVPMWMSSWPIAAAPGEVTIRRAGRGTRRLGCDYLACGFHLVPNIELAQLLGCATQNGCVVVNERQETTVEGVYCAGEPTGIGGVELAEIEGEIAGLAAAGRSDGGLASRREAYRGFAARLEALCTLRPELRELADAETMVCRCEDVSRGRLAVHGDWRSAKLHTRAGMGACQGRVCAAACETLFGWTPPVPRPPLAPVGVGVVAGGGVDGLR
ncbi:MAG TPA: FAD-dependent oxidoreductase [Terriglobales bacterium]|nr:FAD-dependent oxidoreductase [Terriglobales bacterium]